MDAEAHQATADRTVLAGGVQPPASPLRRSPAPETQRLYAGDWAAFVAWCRFAGAVSLPAASATVADYLATLGERLSAGALARRAAAIAAATARTGWSRRPAIRRSPRCCATPAAPPRPVARHRRDPPSWHGWRPTCPRDLAGLRDRALLLLAGTGLGRAGLRRAVLVGLQVEQLRFTASGLELSLPGDDRAERTAPSSCPPWRASGGCPVQALRDWLQASATLFGPVFRKVDRWGNVEHRPLGTDAVRRIVARRTPRRSRRSRATSS